MLFYIIQTRLKLKFEKYFEEIPVNYETFMSTRSKLVSMFTILQSGCTVHCCIVRWNVFGACLYSVNEARRRAVETVGNSERRLASQMTITLKPMIT